MTDVTTVSPEQVQTLLETGRIYVDVRSEPEFEQGHVPGALNVPLQHQGPAGMTPNPDFLATMEAAFGKHEPLIIGCKAGGRSKRAVEMLKAAGFQQLADMSCGFDGSRDAFGRAIPGWKPQGLPVEMESGPGQRYSDVAKRRG